jgi:hypothetical protein
MSDAIDLMLDGVRCLSTAKRKRLRRSSRAHQGFEFNPPRCMNCEHFKPPVHGVPVPGKKKQYRPPSCGLGGFLVEAHSICNKWIGRDGETLE